MKTRTMKLVLHQIDSYADDEVLEFEEFDDKAKCVKRVKLVLGPEGAELIAEHLQEILKARRRRADRLKSALTEVRT